jgi:hypothetical protein
MRLIIPGLILIVASGCTETHRYNRLQEDYNKAKTTIHNQAAGMVALRDQRDAMQKELEGDAIARVGREESTVEALKVVAVALGEISSSNAAVAEAQLAQAEAQTAQTTFWEDMKNDVVLNWPGAVATIAGLFGLNEYRKKRKNGKTEEKD